MNTFVTVLLLIVLVRNDSKSDTEGVISLVCLVVLVASAIFLWIRGTKKYIDFAIEEKINQKRESASSPNENVSEA
ncbi:MAG: hypothetical protein FVQ82_12835 [Planctomycetes bacterium]|nr:hypothetical protein [Planctomycetota bacterium]